MRITGEAKLFCFACFCAIAQLPLGLHAVGFGLPYEASTVATNLAATGEFRDPFGVASGPTAHVASVYPYILATVIRIFRQPEAIIWATVILNACLLGLAAALLPVLSRRVYQDATPGFVGGVLLALSIRLMPQWEVALSALLLLAAALVILQGESGAAGLVAGVSVLANPVSFPPLALLASLRGKRFAGITLVTALALCTPWLIRNWMVLGAPYFVRDNFGLELYISNNDKAGPDLVGNEALWTLHPNQNHEAAAVVVAIGEAAYNRKRFSDALDWIHAHPGQFLWLSARRVFYYWLPPPREGWTAYWGWILTVLAAAGVWLGRFHRTALLLAIVALVYSLPYVVIQTVGRYHFPALWISALLAGYAITVMLKGGRSILAGRAL